MSVSFTSNTGDAMGGGLMENVDCELAAGTEDTVLNKNSITTTAIINLRVMINPPSEIDCELDPKT
jgi:hypothetical protein